MRDDVVLCYEIDTWNNNCNNHDHLWLASETLFTEMLAFAMWNRPSIQLVFVVSCFICSHVDVALIILFQWDVMSMHRMEMSDGCSLDRYFVGFCMRISN